MTVLRSDIAIIIHRDIDITVSAPRKSTVAPCPRDQRGFDPQRTESAAHPPATQTRTHAAGHQVAAQYFGESIGNAAFAANLRSRSARQTAT
jgi:hypothetical protein